MMSNLANQLKEQNALDRIREVFDEIPGYGLTSVIRHW